MQSIPTIGSPAVNDLSTVLKMCHTQLTLGITYGSIWSPRSGGNKTGRPRLLRVPRLGAHYGKESRVLKPPNQPTGQAGVTLPLAHL